MTIIVFGASGKVGRRVVAEALQRGITVRAFVHSQNPFDDEPNLEVTKGDIYRGEDVAQVLKGTDAVVSCLGSWGQKTAHGNRNVSTAAMQAIIPAMQAQKITRIVTLTGSGAVAPNVKRHAHYRLFMWLISPLPVGKVFADGEQHMRLLAASNLDWTTIRSPIMNNMDGIGYRLMMRELNHFRTISREAVAKCMLDQLESHEWLRRAPVIRRAHNR
jgi:putative NADH-flavin reductase